MRTLLIAALSLLLAAFSGGRAAHAPPAAAQRDWTQIVSPTPEGGFRMGNPNAAVKVVEYLSLTCPHCAHFAAESEASLYANYVRTGRVSLEYRNFILNAPDVTAAMLTRCVPSRGFFAMSQELLRTQSQWLRPMQTLTSAQRTQLNALPPLQMVQRLAPLLGLDRIAARHGLAPAAQRACLASQSNLDRLEAMARAGGELGVTGTPTFFINGRAVGTNVWSGIEPLLRAGS